MARSKSSGWCPDPRRQIVLTKDGEMGPFDPFERALEIEKVVRDGAMI